MYRIAVLAIELYRRIVSPYLPPGCRFHPSCSQYAIQALRTRGLLMGTHLALMRILRCHPLAHGGFDPVPEKRDCRRGKRLPASD